MDHHLSNVWIVFYVSCLSSLLVDLLNPWERFFLIFNGFLDKQAVVTGVGSQVSALFPLRWLQSFLARILVERRVQHDIMALFLPLVGSTYVYQVYIYIARNENR